MIIYDLTGLLSDLVQRGDGRHRHVPEQDVLERDETYELHRLLGALLSKELTIDEKLNIIGNEYDIPIEENFRKDVSVMCNLSQEIKEDGIAIGAAREKAQIILNMYKNGFTAEQIASAIDKDIEEVKAIIAGKEPALA